MGDTTIHSQPITQVNTFKYLGFHLYTSIMWACHPKSYAFDRMAQVNPAFLWVKPHVSMLGIGG